MELKIEDLKLVIGANNPNKNGRVYDFKDCKFSHKDDLGQIPVTRGVDFDDGFLNPIHKVVGMATITKMDNTQIEGKITLLDTPIGKTMKELIKSGHMQQISFAPRGIGKIEGNKVHFEEIISFSLISDLDK